MVLLANIYISPVLLLQKHGVQYFRCFLHHVQRLFYASKLGGFSRMKLMEKMIFFFSYLPCVIVGPWQPVYDSILLTLFNTTFTSVSIFLYGLLEQNFTEQQLLNNFHLYRSITGNARMSWTQFLKWNFIGDNSLFFKFCEDIHIKAKIPFKYPHRKIPNACL